MDTGIRRLRERAETYSGPRGQIGSIASSLEGIISGARSSVSEFLNDLVEHRDDFMSDFKRKMNLNSESPSKEDHRRRYRELYSNKIYNKTEIPFHCSKQDDNADKDDFVNQESPVINKSPEKYPIGKQLTSVNFGSVASNELPHGRVDERVHSRIYKSPSLAFGQNHAIKTKAQLLKSNSEFIQLRHMQQSKDKMEVGRSGPKSMQILRKEHFLSACTLHSKNNEENSSSSLDTFYDVDSLILTGQNGKAKDACDNETCSEPTPLQSPFDSTDNPEVKSRDIPPVALSKTVSAGNSKTLHRTRLAGSIYIAIEYLGTSNQLKLTIESVNLLNKESNFSPDTLMGVKVYLTNKERVQKRSSNIVKFKNFSVFNEDIFLKVNCFDLVTPPFLRFKVFRRKHLFPRKRHEAIAESSFHLNREDIGCRLEYSKLLTKCA